MPDVSLSGIEFTIKGSSDSASDSINKLIKNLSSLNSALKNTNGIKEFSKNMSSLGNAIKAISATTLKRIGDALLKISKAGVKGIGGILSAPFKSGYSKLSGYAKSLSGIVRGFKRIIGYRIIRSIIKEITQAFSEGIQNLYGWSALVNGKFKTSMDQIATSMTYFKNSIAAAVAPIINALAPAIDWLVDKIVTLINVLNQLFAKLTGATYWTRAKKKADEYGDSVSGAGQAAQDALHYLAPFDELNVLPSQKDHGGGGGGGTDYSDMFEDVTEFNEAISNFADMIREKIDAGDWQGLGELLGNKVNELVEAIDWAGLGSKVGGYINAWFTTKYWTLQTINFQNIGSSIATFLNNMMGAIDFDIIGRTITQKFTILGDLIIGAVSGINWTLVGQSVGNFIKGAFDQLSDWIQDVDWAAFATDVHDAIKNAIEGLHFADVARSLFRLLGSALGAGVTFIASFVSDVVDDIKGYFKQFIEDENDDGCFSGGEILEGVLKGIDNAIKGLGTWVYNNMFTPFVNAIKSAFGISSSESGATTMAGSGKSIGNGILDGIAIALASPATWIFNNVLTPIIDGLKSGFGITSTESGATATQGIGKSIGQGILDGIAQVFVSPAAWVIEHITDPIKNALSGFSINDLIFGSDSGGGGSSDIGGPSGHSTSSHLSVDVSANITSLTDSLPDSKKKINTTANVTERNLATSVLSPVSLVAQLAGREVKPSVTQPVSLSAILAGRTVKASVTSPVTIKPTLNGRKINDNVRQTFNIKPTLNGRTVNDNVVKPVNLTANATNMTDSIPEYKKKINVTANVTRISGAGENVNVTQEKGGSFFGGLWHNIPQYASGGRPHGSLFLAGEAGAEIVGHVGGRTEVLNRSQLASTMYAAVKSALASINFTLTYPSVSGYTSDSGMSEETLYRAFLAALNDSDIGDRPIELDGDVIYRNVLQRNRMERRRLGANPMMATS